MTPAPRSGQMHKQGAQPGWPDLLTGLDWRARDGDDDTKPQSSYAATLQLQAQTDLCWTDDSVADAILGHASASLPEPCSATLLIEAAPQLLRRSSHSFPNSPRRVRRCCRATQRDAAAAIAAARPAERQAAPRRRCSGAFGASPHSGPGTSYARIAADARAATAQP